MAVLSSALIRTLSNMLNFTANSLIAAGNTPAYTLLHQLIDCVNLTRIGYISIMLTGIEALTVMPSTELFPT